MTANISEIPTPDPRVRVFHSDPEVDCFAIVTRRYLVVIDTFGTPEEAAQMMALLEGDLADHQLLVLNTHTHYDHAWGNAIFAEDGKYPAPILASQKSLETLPQSQIKLASSKTQNSRFANVRIVPPTLTFSERFTVYGGDLTLELIPAPGHASDQVVVWIPEIKVLLAADALEFPFPAVNNPADLPAQFQTMHQLKDLGAEVVLPCHGGIFGPELIDINLEYFTRLEAQAKALESLPDNWQTRPDLPDLVNRSYPTVATELGIPELSDFYRGFHLKNLRATLENL